MVQLDQTKVEEEIIKAVAEINTNLKLGSTINADCRPGESGFTSQVLIDIMPDLEDALGIIIPDNQYIFFDKTNHKQLSIRDAASKLIKVAKDGKK